MRIASLQPSVTITLQALGRLDALCACTEYCLEFLPELASRNLPILHDSWSFDRPADPNDPDKPGNLEALLAAKPDLVLASVPYRMESLAAILKCGLPVLALAPHTLADIDNDIRLIASLVHSVPQGDAIIDRIHRTIAEVKANTRSSISSAVRKPIVYCEEWGKPLIHSQHWVAELVETAGGNFLGEPGSRSTAEAVAALDEDQQPDVLLFAWCGAGNRVPLERVVAQRGWRDLRAVRNGRVFCIPDEFLNTPAPTILDGLACIASAVHPNLFPLHPALVRLNVEQLAALTQSTPHSTLT
jgi:iron complex transport system substrate-binding protein